MPSLRGAIPVVLVSLELALVAAGCRDAESQQPGPTSAPAVAKPPAAPPTPSSGIAWTTCALHTGGNDRNAECAFIDVPLDWTKPGKQKVKFFVKRLIGRATDVAHRQLWLLQGGPGGAGDGLEQMASDAADRDPALDIYIPDHRGTGRSTYLDCPRARKRAPFDYAACASELLKEWGADGLATFSTTTAARDVGHVIEQTRGAGQEVHVYGISYGTYVAQRYLQLFAAQPTSVTLDGVCQAGLCSYTKMGYWFDQVGKKYMRECAADAFCANRLGPDPIAKVREALAVADARTCAGIKEIDGAMLRQLFSYFIASVELRVLIPATTFRVLRCDADDIAALEHLEAAIAKMLDGDPIAFGSEAGNLSSPVLGLNIAFSEMEQSPMLTRAELAALMTDSVFAVPDPRLRDGYDVWPRYPHDEWVGKYPNSPVPVLLMNGTLDPQTPVEFAEQIAPHYQEPAQTLVVFPRAAHGVVPRSEPGEPRYPFVPAVPGEPTHEPCGLSVWQQFLSAPTQALDTSCLEGMFPHAFDASPSIAQTFFGRPSLWTSESVAPAAMAPPSAAAFLAIEGEFRRSVRATRPWVPARLDP